MSLITGINELRSSMTTPREPLYQHLTDLIVALEEVNSTSLNKERNTTPKKMSEKRKVRKKKDKNVTLKVCNIDDNVNPSSNHSRGNNGSDSSAEDFNKHVTVDMSESDNDLNVQQQRCSSAAVVWLKPSLEKVPSFGEKRAFGVLPGESDSFTETFTPARHHRRKRLIKRMVVDQSESDVCDESGIAFRRHSASMDMEVSNSVGNSPRYATKKRRVRKTGSCHSESSMDCTSVSSSESDGNNTSDDGRQGDDEQSDCYFEYPKTSGQHDECMGVPSIRKMLLRKAHRDSGFGGHSNGNNTPPVESSDTDISQSSASFVRNQLKVCGKRLSGKNGVAMASALNKRLVSFLRDPAESELFLGTLRKRERKEALRLSSFYHLDVRCKTSKGIQTYTIVKTRYSLWH